MDELTAAHRRDAGIVELEREVARAKRTQQPVARADKAMYSARQQLRSAGP